MKTYLLTPNGNFYKANLHCHSIISDGKRTVDELKKMYMEQGYSAIAFTDHQVFLTHNDLTDKDFVALNGYEVDINGGTTALGARQVCHFCCVALDDKLETQRIYYESRHLTKNIDAAKLDPDQSYREREYTPEYISALMQEARDNGFFVTYNHPAWSLENFEQYGHYHGMHAMEIVNYGCIEVGYEDHNESAYDEMIMGGERIFCIATDDNHNGRNDSFGGFTMIKADELSYKALADALLAGNFYASEGPEIKELWYEDGRVYIRSSEAVKVTYVAGRRKARAAYPDGADTLTEASFEVVPEDICFRLTVFDKEGRKAYTNAYFIDKLPQSEQEQA